MVGHEKTQKDTYEGTSRHIITSFMDGFNGTIFAYGQSGSGKTFTMLGPEDVTESLIRNSDAIPEDV